MTPITIDRATVEQALEALETLVPTKGPSIYNSARDDLRAALAQQAEPGFWGRVAARQASRIKQIETAAQQALSWIHYVRREYAMDEPKEERALRAALAQQVEPVEPVGEMQLSGIIDGLVVPVVTADLPEGTKLYTSSPQRKPLTEEEIERLWYPSAVMAEPGKRRVAFGRAVERAHGITDPQIADRLARHGIPMPGDPK